MDLATVPGSSQLPKFLSGWPHHQQPTLPTKQWICWGFGGNHQETDGKTSERRKTMELWPNLGPHPSALLFHHHWRCWQEEDHIQPFHSFHQVLVRTWKPPGFKKNCWRGKPTAIPQEPTWIWTLDNLSLSRKWVETFGKLLLLTNQQLSLIPIGWDFQTIPYWEGPGQWSNPGLYLLISSCRLKHSHGTLKERPTHILLTPSISWMETQCCLLHQWQVWPLQQQLIGTAKSVKQLILSFLQRHPSLPWVEPHPVFLQHLDIPPDPPKVFLEIGTLHPRSDFHGIQWMFRLCRIMQWKVVRTHSA